MIGYADPHYDIPEYLSEAWYRLHRHLAGSSGLWSAACDHRAEAVGWHSAYRRLGDTHHIEHRRWCPIREEERYERAA